MALLDIFTGDPQKEAAAKAQAAIAAAQAKTASQVASAQTQGIGALQSGLAGAQGAIAGGVATGTNAINAAAPASIDALRSGQMGGTEALTSGRDAGLAALSGGVNTAEDAFRNLGTLGTKYGDRATQASDMSANALGLNGPGGNDAATSAFRADPGYKFSVDQGLEGILRNANAAGGAFGGNQLRESQTFGQGLADQQYQTWLKNLAGRESLYAPLEASTTGAGASGVANAALTGGTGAANLYSGTAGRLSDLISGTGAKTADVLTGQGQSLADLASKGGLATGAADTGTGQSIADLISRLTQTGVGFDQSALPQLNKTYTDQAAAETGGSANLWSLIGNAGKAAAGLGYIPSGGYAPAKF